VGRIYLAGGNVEVTGYNDPLAHGNEVSYASIQESDKALAKIISCLVASSRAVQSKKNEGGKL
jgi:hypothetical protein